MEHQLTVFAGSFLEKLQRHRIPNRKGLHHGILLQHGLGDVMMAIPMVRDFCRGIGREDTVVIFVRFAGSRDVLQLAAFGPKIDVRLHAPWGVGSLLQRVRAERFDTLVFPHSSQDWKVALFARLSGARVTVGPDVRLGGLLMSAVVPSERGQHKASYYRRYARTLGLPVQNDHDVRIFVPPSGKANAREILGNWSNIVAVFPGSAKKEPHKRWPAVEYASLSRRLLAEIPACSILYIGGPDERDLMEFLNQQHAGEQRVKTHLSSSIAGTLALLDQCKVAIAGCCSGGHFAAAAGLPIVGLFGPTNPGFTGPYSPRLWTIRASMGCSPCYGADFEQGCGNPICMQRIQVDTVLAAVKAAMTDSQGPDVPWLAATGARSPQD